jgi:hypothetical protein
MTLKVDNGCNTPRDAMRKQVYKRLIEIFAPILHFHPEEKFFPVDLPSAIQNSSVWLFDPKSTPLSSKKIWDTGAFNPVQDVPNTTKYHYTTIAGVLEEDKLIEGQTGQPEFKIKIPIPNFDLIEQYYTDGTILAELTIYATVCTARDVTNSHLVAQDQMYDYDVREAYGEGIVVNYYMYFPAHYSEQFQSEGDWSGISLLLRKEPRQLDDLSSTEKIKRFLPVLACYYRKTFEGTPPLPHFLAKINGFRRWENVNRDTDKSIGLDTHPNVYISLGRHNCYYEPVTDTTSVYTPWEGQFSPDSIESGKITPGPSDNTVYAESDWAPWWAFVVFPPFIFFQASGAGCPDFPPITRGSIGDDFADNGGYKGKHGTIGSQHPKRPASENQPSQRNVDLRLIYVDLEDIEMAALWGYPGAWGGAKLVGEATLIKETKGIRLKKWGYYQGVRRPILSAWFLWNLFQDYKFGCGGVAKKTAFP